VNNNNNNNNYSNNSNSNNSSLCYSTMVAAGILMETLGSIVSMNNSFNTISSLKVWVLYAIFMAVHHNSSNKEETVDHLARHYEQIVAVAEEAAEAAAAVAAAAAVVAEYKFAHYHQCILVHQLIQDAVLEIVIMVYR
jgi:hypothetical protein